MHPHPTFGGGRSSVVVADDHPVILEVLQRAVRSDERLALAGVARDGDTALELVRRQRPHVALLDHLMPGRTGGEVAAALAAEQIDVPVVILTTIAEHEQCVLRTVAGVHAVLGKETNRRELCDFLVAVATRTG